MNKAVNETMFEHAWRYFEKHSDQRVSFFNFYILIMAASSTALSIILQNENASHYSSRIKSFSLA